MAQKSEPVFIVQRRAVGSTVWENVRVADDRADARKYAERMNAWSMTLDYRVYPKRVTKL